MGLTWAHHKDVNFNVTDVPGHWFDTGVDIARTHSLSIVAPGEVIKFRQEGSIMGTLVWTVPDLLSPAPLERPEDMRPSRPCLRLLCPRLTLLLSLMLLAGLAGCGPASSDNAPNLGPSASVGGPLLSKQGPSPRNDPFTPVASPVPLALLNGPGAAAGTGTVPGGDSPHAVPVLASEPGHPVDGLVVPEWMAQKLNSPNVRVRLRALETWAQSAPPGAVDPLILAFEDKDERVRARAQQLIEQDWARKAEAEQ
jgi:hypothetical protein